MTMEQAAFERWFAAVIQETFKTADALAAILNNASDDIRQESLDTAVANFDGQLGAFKAPNQLSPEQSAELVDAVRTAFKARLTERMLGTTAGNA
jgi:hypothetical protein